MNEQDSFAFPIHSVGPCDLGEDELLTMTGSYLWLIYWYENSGYEGSGVAIALRKDGKIDTGNLGHCSCYGPTDDWPDATEEISETLFEVNHNVDCPGSPDRKPADYDYTMWQALGVKIRELLS